MTDNKTFEVHKAEIDTPIGRVRVTLKNKGFSVYNENTGFLRCENWVHWKNFPNELANKIKSQQQTIQNQKELIDELKEILLDAGARSHRSKKLYDWYCKNGNGHEESGYKL